MIVIVDYRAGNIASVKRAVEHLGLECVVTSEPAQVERAERIIVPGVGNFRATRQLHETGLQAVMKSQIAEGKPLLGICLGMQWLFSASDEAPEASGLAEFHGTCHRFSAGVKSPHVGWNRLEASRESRLLQGIPKNAFVYFTHNYYAPVIAETIAVTTHGARFTAALERTNLFGVQFHPEKSGEIGLAVLRNFCQC